MCAGGGGPPACLCASLTDGQMLPLSVPAGRTWATPGPPCACFGGGSKGEWSLADELGAPAAVAVGSQSPVRVAPCERRRPQCVYVCNMRACQQGSIDHVQPVQFLPLSCRCPHCRRLPSLVPPQQDKTASRRGPAPPALAPPQRDHRQCQTAEAAQTLGRSPARHRQLVLKLLLSNS